MNLNPFFFGTGTGEVVRPVDHIAWIYNQDSALAGKYWMPPRDLLPIFNLEEVKEGGWWKWNQSLCLTSEEVSGLFVEMFGEDFPASELHWVTGSSGSLGTYLWRMKK